MARPRYPKQTGPLPPPLPPQTRTVGQLVAESIRLYGDRFLPVLALGLSIAGLDAIAVGRSIQHQTVLLWIFTPLITVSYVAACALVAEHRPPPRALLVGLAVGILVWLPVPLLFRFVILPALAWLALIGLAVPAAVIERRGFVDSFRRGLELARADFVHAFGSLAALAIVYFLSRTVLLFLLRTQSDNAIRTAGFLADLVLSPLLFVGAAMLFVDQAARVRSSNASTSTTTPA
ncbi:MAG: hypothetical protein QOG29_588 [Gaiellaceae bacterium]|nr:hypothetical protein [Gaiellaceae bacterium]MDX6492125.1 hypothetical protein [Gaiellaceae bacterium]MDX6517573.1 hypothetical protein [Gaiellaceae bacterium]